MSNERTGADLLARAFPPRELLRQTLLSSPNRSERHSRAIGRLDVAHLNLRRQRAGEHRSDWARWCSLRATVRRILTRHRSTDPPPHVTSRSNDDMRDTLA